MSTPIVHEAVQRTRTYAHGDKDARPIFAKRLIGQTDVHEYGSGMYCHYVAKERTLMVNMIFLRYYILLTSHLKFNIFGIVIVCVQNTVYEMQFARIHAMTTV